MTACVILGDLGEVDEMAAFVSFELVCSHRHLMVPVRNVAGEQGERLHTKVVKGR